jgi:sugar diacid utilization regulator
VRTLDAYLRNDMRRADTAAGLNIHPRTLDYRLRRVRDLTGIDPGTALGVRAFSVAVARTLVDG